MLEIPLPPCNVEVEQALLGALLAHEGYCDRVRGLVSPGDFFEPVHEKIFRAICTAKERGEPTSPLTLQAYFDNDATLQSIGGGAYLQRMAARSQTLANPEVFAKSVRDLGLRRQAMALCERYMRLLSEADYEAKAAELVQLLAADLVEAKGNSSTRPLVPVSEVNRAILGELSTPVYCTPTGLTGLDGAMGGGLYQGKSYGFAARKKKGKTFLASTLSHNLNMAGVKHLFICGEMGAKEIQQRVVARVAGYNALAFIDPARRDTLAFKKAVSEAIATIPDNVVYRDAPGLTFPELRLLVTEALSQGIKGFILDYWQLVGGKKNQQSMAEHLESIAQWIADSCRDKGIWSIVMAQINQEGNTRGSEGMRLAFDQVYELCRQDDGMGAWLVMMDSRYTMWQNVGSENIPGLVLRKDIGPFFDNP